KSETMTASIDAVGRITRPNFTPEPRLFTGQQAAIYLGYGSAEVLRHLPIAPVRLTGPGGRPRWDRRHLDKYLDDLARLGGANSSADARDDAGVAIAALRARHVH